MGFSIEGEMKCTSNSSSKVTLLIMYAMKPADGQRNECVSVKPL